MKSFCNFLQVKVPIMQIKDCCTFEAKSTIKAGAACARGKFVFFTSSQETKNIDEFNYDGEFIIMGTGGSASLHYYNGKFATSTDCFVLKPLPFVKGKYLYYLLMTQMNVLEQGFKGAGLKHTNKKYVSSIEVGNIPSITEQNRIIAKLDVISRLIENAEYRKRLYNELIKNTFYDRFGDVEKNPHNYPTHSFNDVTEYIGDIGSNGANKVVAEHLKMKNERDYALMVRFLNFTKNDFKNDVKYVSKETYEFFRKSKVYGGELIICKIGSAGQNYIMPRLNMPVSLGLNQIMVRTNGSILVEYLYHYLHTEFGEYQISKCINGAVTKTITKTELKKIPVLLPPMSEQQNFVSTVNHLQRLVDSVEKIKMCYKEMLDSIAQTYFN